MSYQVLARKWRPKIFSELMGQEHVVSVLVNAISQQRLHHAYLFTGTRGVGKTTIARIFAKSLNCEQGVSAEPCGKCDVCLDIDEGRFVDLLEIDAASRTKVDDTREILDNVQYAPTRGRYKVYLIDEVHMLSRSSFNALLKTLEEPPAHVKFILATTDPQKLPVTVLSRCLQFHLKALSVAQIAAQLAKILQAENVTYEDESLTILAKAARGSMRDSLSLTDQAIAQGQGNISVANLQHMLGGIDQHWPYKILISLLKQDAQALMTLSREIASYAPNYSRLYAELIQLLHHIAMYQVVEQHFDVSPEHAGLIKRFSQAMSAQDVQLYYQLVLNSRKDLPYAADEQAAFDMTLLRLLAFKPMTEAPIKVEQRTVQPVSFDDLALSESQVARDVPKVDAEPIAEPVIADESEPAALSAPENQVTENNTADDEVEQVGAEEFHLDNDDYQQQSDILAQELQAVEQTASEQHVAAQAQESIPRESIDEVALVEAQTEPEPVESVIEQTPVDLAVDDIEPTPAVSEQGVFSSSVESALATRNMLRSRKKKLESEAKKPKDAETRQQTQVTQNKPVIDVPDIASIPDNGFEAEAIDPSVIKKANQVDKWANMIDAMALNGRLRILAQQAVISKQTTDEHLILELNQSAKHLKTDVGMEQLRTFVSDYFGQPTAVDVEIVEETIDDPLKIQGQINEKRYDYAREILANDPVVQRLQHEFQAQLDESTIIAR